ncbi:MAG: hypothetical protein E7003_03145 [Eggerthellaceae bacterium]|nr:hypothetical protein [Eggerthellaceae bacterium]
MTLEIDDRYPEFAAPYAPEGLGKHRKGLTWGGFAFSGFLLILLVALVHPAPFIPDIPEPILTTPEIVVTEEQTPPPEIINPPEEPTPPPEEPDVIQYTVTFVDWDASTISSAKYDEGTKASDISVPDDPVRPNDDEFSYIFIAWTPELADVTGDATYTAAYLTEELPRYNVTFVDYDGMTVLQAETSYAEGTKAADIVQPATPTRASTAQYDYVFAGWSPEVSDVTGDATYTATYDETLRQYNVTFVDEDGSTELLPATAYDYGTAAADISQPTTPTKPSDASYDYTFAGWSPDLAEVTGDATYTATYTATPIAYSAPTIELVPKIETDGTGDWPGAIFTSIVTLNDVAGNVGQLKLQHYNYDTQEWDDVSFYNDGDEGWPEGYVDLYAKTSEDDAGTLLSPSDKNALYDIPEDAKTLEAEIIWLLPLFDDEGVWLEGHRTRDIVRLVFDYEFPNGETGTAKLPEDFFYVYYDWFFEGEYANEWEFDSSTKTLTLTIPYQVDRGGPLDYDSIYWYPHLYDEETGAELNIPYEISNYTEADGTVVAKIVYTFDTLVPGSTYRFNADAIYSDYGDEEHWNNWLSYTQEWGIEYVGPEYVAPTIDLVHELYYYEGGDDHFVDFTATVDLNDVAGSTGQLKLKKYDAFKGEWVWVALTDDTSEVFADFLAYVQLYTTKDGERTALSPSDYNALYDIPEDAEGLEADIGWRFPWYIDDEGNFCWSVRETMSLAFDYVLPNGETGTVSLADDFYLYQDWFFGQIDKPVLDETAKTITLYYQYEVDYGGPLNYDNIYWHPHLYDHATGEEFDMTPVITRINNDDGTVGDKLVYTFDTLVPGKKYDFTAQVIYSDYGVDDADHWNNWVISHSTYDPMEFDIDYVEPTISPISSSSIAYDHGSAGSIAHVASEVTLNDVAGSTGMLALLREDPDDPDVWVFETLGDDKAANVVDLEYYNGSAWVALDAPSDLNVEYEIPADATQLRADMTRSLIPPGGMGGIRVKSKIAFEYTFPDNRVGEVTTSEFFLYRGSFVQGNGTPVLDRDAGTITMDFIYHLVEGGEIDPDKVTWLEHHLYKKPKSDTSSDYGTEITGLTPTVVHSDEGGVHHVTVTYTLGEDDISSDSYYTYQAKVLDDEWGDSTHWNNWETSAYRFDMEFPASDAHEKPTIGIYSSYEYGGDSGDWHIGFGIVGTDETTGIPDDLKGGKARIKFMRYDEDADAWVDIDFISAAEWEANDAKPWSDPTKVTIGDKQMFFGDVVYLYKDGDDSSTTVSTASDPTAMIELGDSDSMFASMMYHLPENPTWEPVSTLIKPVMDYEYPDGTTGTAEGNPMRVFSGGFVSTNTDYGSLGVITNTEEKTISMDFIIDGGSYAINSDDVHWNDNSLHWQDVSDGSYNSERYKDPPDDTHGWVTIEGQPTMNTYTGDDGKTHVTITYTLDEINTAYAYDYRGVVYYFNNDGGESGMWEAFPTQLYIRFS